ncbi:MAG: DMT family transporter [Devosia sp.]|jgi:transporter family-2 protein|nr:DMT family transporter [Devosia sp.]
MIEAVVLAFVAGGLVGVSRQLNGRLAVSTSALFASFCNHLVGFVLLTAIGLVIGGLVSDGAFSGPWHIYFGGPVGVVFVALSSWIVGQIGATRSTMLIIAGQVLGGVALDWALTGKAVSPTALCGIVLIVAGVLVAQRQRASTAN